MNLDLGIGLGAAGLIIGFPLVLLGFVSLLGRLENWMLAPDERAAAVRQLLEQVDETEELERAVTTLMADVTRRPNGRKPRMRALQLASRRAARTRSRARRAG